MIHKYKSDHDEQQTAEVEEVTSKKIKKKNIAAGSIVSSPMLRRFLVPILLTMFFFTGGVYLFAVPYLKDLVYSLEEKSVQTNLKNIHKLIEANSLATEAYKESVMSANKRQLKNITLFTETHLKNEYEKVSKGLITEDEAQLSALEELRSFRYGNNDYVWVADYRGYYLSHPDPDMNMKDFSEVRDVFGNFVLTPLILQAMKDGEGYNSYWWQRLENDLPAEKLTYARLFPQWEWIIGTGVYLDDLETEILVRKEKMIEELRQIIKEITIARTGYMYIFDAWKNIIIHPNSEFENANMSAWENQYTGKKLADELMFASRAKNNKVAYKWNRPDDKRNFIYEKIDWVTHVEGFDWYVVASVYTDELNISSVHLRNRIIILGVAVVVLSIIIVTIMMGRLLKPIHRLSHTAALVKNGDLTAQIDVGGRDEIGFLARAFNAMIDRLRETIDELDRKVLERTMDLNKTNEELTATVGELEQHNWKVTQLNSMAEKLQACNSMLEIYTVIIESLSGLFPHTSGILYMCRTDEDNNNVINPVIKWGEHKYPVREHALSTCRSFTNGKVLLADIQADNMQACGHINIKHPYVSICMPLIVQSNALGMVHLVFESLDQTLLSGERTQILENQERLAKSVGDQLAMAVSNMQLRVKLENLSVRDSLTGLFNRRYMEETLQREFTRAERSGEPVGVIILDVDFFKQYNDTYGHKAGDAILVEMSNYLSKNIRKGDVVCRYGGEEFVIILPGASADRTLMRAETVRGQIEKDLRIVYNKEWLPITVSLGAAAFPEHGNSSDKVLKAADDSLYKAKKQGRNRVILAGQPLPH